VAEVLLVSGTAVAAVLVAFLDLITNLCRVRTTLLSVQVVRAALVVGTVAHEAQAVLTLSLAH
jgi:hypothetical protein